MSAAVERAFADVRNEIFARTPWLAALELEGAPAATMEAMLRFKHRFQAWQVLRGRLTPGQVRLARERGERWAERIVETREVIERIRTIERQPVIELTIENIVNQMRVYVDEVTNVAITYPTPAPRPPKPPFVDVVWDWDSFRQRFHPRLPRELVDALARVLAELVDGFLEQLEEVGRFELPAQVPVPIPVEVRRAGDVVVAAPAVLDALGLGTTVGVGISVAAGAGAVVVSAAFAGPVVIEHVVVQTNSTSQFDVDARVRGSPEGALDVGSEPRQLGGEPLVLLAGNTAQTRNGIPIGGGAQFAELWPFKLWERGAGYISFSAFNGGGATQIGYLVASLRRVAAAA